MAQPRFIDSFQDEDRISYVEFDSRTLKTRIKAQPTNRKQKNKMPSEWSPLQITVLSLVAFNILATIGVAIFSLFYGKLY